MRERAIAGVRVAQRRARLHARPGVDGQDGFTLTEMLVVLLIVGIVLVGITQLFTSALKSEKDQTNRTQAQQDARLGLDKLRREIRCANTLTTPGGYPASAITITLGSYCPTAGGAAATVTWCTKDKNGATPPVAGAQPYTLWRYTGSACSGTGTRWASDLVDKVDVPSISAGQIFGAAFAPAGAGFVPAASLTPASTGGTLLSGTYSYDVTAVLAGGVEVPGTVASVTIASGLTNQITVNWAAYTGATSYNVYGRDGSGLRLLKNVTSSSYVDTGPTSLDPPSPATSFTVPSSGSYSIPVVSTSNFNSSDNAIAFGASGVVTCTGTGTTPTSFTGCSGGQAGQYAKGTPVYTASSARPPRATLSVSLALDKTPASTSQRFVLVDNIVLRNSRPF
jgi:prepilin-type N-terminal cleavage/methylation domain-containing protein